MTAVRLLWTALTMVGAEAEAAGPGAIVSVANVPNEANGANAVKERIVERLIWMSETGAAGK